MGLVASFGAGRDVVNPIDPAYRERQRLAELGDGELSPSIDALGDLDGLVNRNWHGQVQDGFLASIQARAGFSIARWSPAARARVMAKHPGAPPSQPAACCL